MMKLIIISGFVPLALLIFAGPSYRLELLDLGQAFGLMRWAVYLGAANAVLVIGYSAWRRPGRWGSLALASSALAGLAAVFIPLALLQMARSVPPIHDISTDLHNPPAFVDTVALRQDAPNPPGYAGLDTARQQLVAYPDIQPLVLNTEMDQVYQMAQDVVHSLNWRLISATKDEGREQARIEAVDTTFWFGFKDDIVVRLQVVEEGTRVDVRSKSRVGKSDLGKNAARIQKFFRSLEGNLSRG